MSKNESKDRQIEIIRRRYNKKEFNVVADIDRQVLLRNLRKIVDPDRFRDKAVLEIGAGCSLYLPIFLDSGCGNLVANDLVDERLKLNQITDDRYVEVAGEFLETQFEEEGFDIIFSHLTLMFVIPMLDEFFAKMHKLLRPGGLLITFDANYLCPLQFYRRFSDRSGSNPATIFNPFSYAGRARKIGFNVEKLVPSTNNCDWATGNWLLGTGFFMRATKSLES